MLSPQPSQPPPVPYYPGPPTQEGKVTYWNLFLETSPNEDNQHEFRVFLDNAVNKYDMKVAASIIRLAQSFKCSEEFFISIAGPQGGHRMFVESVLETVPDLEDAKGEEWDRAYEEAFPFGHTAQGILYGKLYGLNNRSGCQRSNWRTRSSRQ
ncbi:uncharacterized protein N7496_005439 [Penicillium cataractarum]|uniref:Uncharacterized protein n=1 Tax=Penicillium cataractarum TaxID=2100454 RepID=A0A9W9SHD4_9EURO|nr:uncharacterized protein N7496_005439 [Penicillium cataractarum]KAJ5378030.1 hypothetical protein N7496_005439 [Penicillium cataractarum]